MILLFAIISSYIIIISWNNNNFLYANSMMMVLQQQHSSLSLTQRKDWNIYNLQKKYHDSGGILYKPSVLTSTEYNTIVNDLQSSMMDDDDNNIILKEEDESLSFATNRIGAQISNESEIYRVISCKEGSLCTLVNNLADYVVEGDDDDGLGGRHNEGDDDDMPESERRRSELGKMVLAPDIPIEVSVFLCVCAVRTTTYACIANNIHDLHSRVSLLSPISIYGTISIRSVCTNKRELGWNGTLMMYCTTLNKLRLCIQLIIHQIVPHCGVLMTNSNKNNNVNHYCQQQIMMVNSRSRRRSKSTASTTTIYNLFKQHQTRH